MINIEALAEEQLRRAEHYRSLRRQGRLETHLAEFFAGKAYGLRYELPGLPEPGSHNHYELLKNLPPASSAWYEGYFNGREWRAALEAFDEE